MKLFLKFVFASIIGVMWYRVGGDDSTMAIAITLFVFVLLVLVMQPIEFQSPEKREEYIQKMREKRERRLMIEAKQKEELLRMKKINKAKEEQRLAEYREKFEAKSRD
ncbi:MULTISPECIES: hypothetical protein [unclassified Helicobacter]|uniref:hypothetical protein n=1 Tax=unclassified Helicobacter TaxID=2593540 RepID=UPI000CF11BE7|nr:MULTISPECIES: hypothetical protein [unclassified Helicobacter]